ncbi:hypothetical protein [Shewanella woodyi]|uniref:hypothetical protein n=1 Tax=Shewanella woodyi TaxID=60961 RepID=UPI0037481096
MFTFLRRHTLLVFTLLAMLSQGVFASGSMIGMSPTHEAMMSGAHHSQMMSMKNGESCHTEQKTTPSHCCELEQTMLPGAAQNCCDGEGLCKGDCNHCLVISMTGTLFSSKSWSGFSPSEFVMATQMPHFHSISLPQDIRPPIA